MLGTLGKRNISSAEVLERGFWSNAAQWPKGNSGNVFLGAALCEVGAALMPGEWQEGDVLATIAFVHSKDDLLRFATYRPPQPIGPNVPISLSMNATTRDERAARYSATNP
jgi:hypothetical protein